jgi:hypothetical protein
MRRRSVSMPSIIRWENSKLSNSLCSARRFAMSILGGLITVFIQYMQMYTEAANPSSIITKFGDTLPGLNLPLVLTEIISRIPINIVDRLIAAFAGFGLALGGNKLRLVFLSRSKEPQVGTE